MKTYPIVEITFSPTGGTKKVADQISCYLGNITNTVNLIRHDVSFSDVTVPSDSLAYPRTDSRYLTGDMADSLPVLVNLDRKSVV